MSSPTIALVCEMLSATTWRTAQTLALLQLRGNQFQIFSGAASATGARLFISDDQVGTSEAFFRCTKLGTNFFEITTEGRVLAGFGGGGGTPDWSFYNDDDTGIRRSAEDVIEVDCGGVEIVKFSADGLLMQSTGTLQLSAGLASLPAINFGQATGDSNTGFYQISADTIGVATGGTLRLTINSSGIAIAGGLTVAAASAFSSFQSLRPFANLAIEEEFAGYFIDENTVANGWRSFDSAGTGSVANGTASGSAWGLVTVTTGATSGNGRHLGLGTVSSNGAFDDLNSIAPWEAWFRFSISATTSILTFVGFLSNPFGAETTCDKIALRFDTASDSTFKVMCRSGGSETVTDTTVTPSASTFYSLRIWSESAGTIKFRVYSAAGAALGNEVTISTNVPSSVMSPDFYVHTLTSAARTLNADTFRMQATLTR